MKRIGYIDARRIAGFTFPATATPGNGLVLTIVDPSIIASGTNRGIHLDYNHSGVKAGGSVSAIGVELNIAAAAEYVNGIDVYVDTSDDPDVTWIAGMGVYMADSGSGTVIGHMCLDLGKESTNQGVDRDCFIRFRTHAGQTKDVFRLEGAEMAEYLVHVDYPGAPWEAGDVTNSKTPTGGLRCYIKDVGVGVIPLYPD